MRQAGLRELTRDVGTTWVGGAQTSTGLKGQAETLVFPEPKENQNSRDAVGEAVGRRGGCEGYRTQVGREQEGNPPPRLLWPFYLPLVPSTGQSQRGSGSDPTRSSPGSTSPWLRAGQKVERGWRAAWQPRSSSPLVQGRDCRG